jgi:hypothetical protein
MQADSDDNDVEKGIYSNIEPGDTDEDIPSSQEIYIPSSR